MDDNTLRSSPVGTDQVRFIVSSASMGEITISRYGRTRFWAVRDVSGELICVCVYKRGAMEVPVRQGHQ